MFAIIFVLAWISCGITSYSISVLLKCGGSNTEYENATVAIVMGPLGLLIWSLLALKYYFWERL